MTERILINKDCLPPIDQPSAPRTLEAGALAEHPEMSKAQARAVLNRAKDGQPIDRLLITTALYLTGDLVDSRLSQSDLSE